MKLPCVGRFTHRLPSFEVQGKARSLVLQRKPHPRITSAVARFQERIESILHRRTVSQMVLILMPFHTDPYSLFFLTATVLGQFIHQHDGKSLVLTLKIN